MRSTCSGMCLTASDIGFWGHEVAYPHPLCPEHGSPDHPYREVRIHDLHTGPMGVCECGEYRDLHDLRMKEA